MPLFNLQSYCEERNYQPALVRVWLILTLRKHSFEQNIELSENEIEDVSINISNGAEHNFDISKIQMPIRALRFLEFLLKKIEMAPKVEDLKFKIRVFKGAVAGIEDQLQLLEEEISKYWVSKTENEKMKLIRLTLIKSRLLIEMKSKKQELDELIEISVKEKRARFNNKFYHLAKERLISSFPDLIRVKNLNLPTQQVDQFTVNNVPEKDKKIVEVHFPVFTNESLVSNIPENGVALIPWENVIFGEKFILLKHEGKLFKRIPLDKSKRSFNAIKELYKNRKLAPLEVHYSQDRVTKIVNMELLTFMFMFFDHSGTDFYTNDLLSLLKSSQPYSKGFYKKYLPDFFSPRCFSYLIEKCDEHSPVIPLPERVVNSTGIGFIHDAFLFPIRKTSCYYWVLESVEEKKATYIFETSLGGFIEEIQLLYDFLSGDFKNKRLALSKKVIDSHQLKIVKRIKHSDFSTWKNAIDYYAQLDVNTW